MRGDTCFPGCLELLIDICFTEFLKEGQGNQTWPFAAKVTVFCLTPSSSCTNTVHAVCAITTVIFVGSFYIYFIFEVVVCLVSVLLKKLARLQIYFSLFLIFI